MKPWGILILVISGLLIISALLLTSGPEHTPAADVTSNPLASPAAVTCIPATRAPDAGV